MYGGACDHRPSYVGLPPYCGAVVSANSWHGHGSLVNDHVYAAAERQPSAVPTLPSSRAVYCVAAASGADGVSVAVLLAESYVTWRRPARRRGPVRVNVDPLTVEA